MEKREDFFWQQVFDEYIWIDNQTFIDTQAKINEYKWQEILSRLVCRAPIYSKPMSVRCLFNGQSVFLDYYLDLFWTNFLLDWMEWNKKCQSI